MKISYLYLGAKHEALQRLENHAIQSPISKGNKQCKITDIFKTNINVYVFVFDL